jgi:homogentisate 1,2-dioxygenase
MRPAQAGRIVVFPRGQRWPAACIGSKVKRCLRLAGDQDDLPDIPMFGKNTAVFIRDLDAGSLANADGDSNSVRVQVLTNSVALDRERHLAVIRRLTGIVAAAADNRGLHDWMHAP